MLSQVFRSQTERNGAFMTRTCGISNWVVCVKSKRATCRKVTKCGRSGGSPCLASMGRARVRLGLCFLAKPGFQAR